MGNPKTHEITRLARCTTDAEGVDEVCVGDWLHLEAMSIKERGPVHYWLRIGERAYDVFINKKTGAVEVQEERERHAQLVEAQIDEQWAFNLQLQELRGELAARGVGDYKHSSHGVTLSWEDAAKLIGGSS